MPLLRSLSEQMRVKSARRKVLFELTEDREVRWVASRIPVEITSNDVKVAASVRPIVLTFLVLYPRSFLAVLALLVFPLTPLNVEAPVFIRFGLHNDSPCILEIVPFIFFLSRCHSSLI